MYILCLPVECLRIPDYLNCLQPFRFIYDNMICFDISIFVVWVSWWYYAVFWFLHFLKWWLDHNMICSLNLVYICLLYFWPLHIICLVTYFQISLSKSWFRQRVHDTFLTKIMYANFSLHQMIVKHIFLYCSQIEFYNGIHKHFCNLKTWF